ncbi:MAG: hypothetical protein Q7T77_03855 [Sulfuricurvum sp.]|nr:hypothetical protein [Sulfuricurvum sp.]
MFGHDNIIKYVIYSALTVFLLIALKIKHDNIIKYLIYNVQTVFLLIPLNKFRKYLHGKKRAPLVLKVTEAKKKVDAQINKLTLLNCQMFPEQNNQKNLLMTQVVTNKNTLDGFNGKEESFIENDFIKEADVLDLKITALENEMLANNKKIEIVEPQIKTISDFLAKSKKSVTDWAKELLAYSSIGGFDPYSKDLKPILDDVNRLLKIIKTIKTCSDMKNFIEKYSEEVEALRVQVDIYSISMKKLKAGISKESNGFKLKCPNPECELPIGKLQDGDCPLCQFHNVIETYRLTG